MRTGEEWETDDDILLEKPGSGHKSILQDILSSVKQLAVGKSPDIRASSPQQLIVTTETKPTPRCSSCQYFTGVMILFAVVLAVAAFVVNYRNSAAVHAVEKIATSQFIRYADQQNSHPVYYITDQFGDKVSPDDVQTEDLKKLTLLHGQIDVHEMRVDWALTLIDPNGWIGPSPSAELWAQSLNGTSGFMQHVLGSPLALPPFQPSGTRDDINMPALTAPGTLLTLVVKGPVTSVHWFIPLL